MSVVSHRVRCKTRLRFGSVSPRLSRAFHLVKVVVQVRLRAPLRIEHRIERVVKRPVFVVIVVVLLEALADCSLPSRAAVLARRFELGSGLFRVAAQGAAGVRCEQLRVESTDTHAHTPDHRLPQALGATTFRRHHVLGTTRVVPLTLW